MRSEHLLTSEGVSEGHPDKDSDPTSDAIVDLLLAKGSEARIACEALSTSRRVVLAGEVRCRGVFENGKWVAGAREDIKRAVRRTVREIGSVQDGFHWETLVPGNRLHEQSSEIAQGVDASGNKDEGAGDPGIMFGFHRFSRERKSGEAAFLEPDSKSQLTLRYRNGKPVACTAVVVSSQHARSCHESEKEAELKAYVQRVVGDIVPVDWLSDKTVWHINLTGSFEIGGPDCDAGLMGRKIIVDSYGGAAPDGRGAFSSKDPTKVDRSATYVTRFLAKNIVAAGLATRCTIQLSYAISVSRQLSLNVDTHGAGTVGETTLEDAIRSFETLGGLTPRGIRTHLGLNKSIYRQSAAYCHFGRTPEGDLFPWERTDMVEALEAEVKG